MRGLFQALAFASELRITSNLIARPTSLTESPDAEAVSSQRLYTALQTKAREDNSVW